MDENQTAWRNIKKPEKKTQIKMEKRKSIR